MDRWGCRGCRALYGAWLSRCPRCGSAEELVMALNECAGCTTKFAVGLPKCPHCGSTEYVEDGAMAKIGRHMGASDRTLPVPDTEPEPAAASEPLNVTADLAGPAQPVEVGVEDGPELVETEGGEESSPGSSSSASTEKPQPTSEPSEPQTPSRVRKTASRSTRARTENSSASSTDGDQTEATSAPDGAE